MDVGQHAGGQDHRDLGSLQGGQAGPVEVHHPPTEALDGLQRGVEIGRSEEEIEVLVQAGCRIPVAELDEYRSLEDQPRPHRFVERIGQSVELGQAASMRHARHLAGAAEAAETALVHTDVEERSVDDAGNPVEARQSDELVQEEVVVERDRVTVTDGRPAGELDQGTPEGLLHRVAIPGGHQAACSVTRSETDDTTASKSDPAQRT